MLSFDYKGRVKEGGQEKIKRTHTAHVQLQAIIFVLLKTEMQKLGGGSSVCSPGDSITCSTSVYNEYIMSTTMG